MLTVIKCVNANIPNVNTCDTVCFNKTLEAFSSCALKLANAKNFAVTITVKSNG